MYSSWRTQYDQRHSAAGLADRLYRPTHTAVAVYKKPMPPKSTALAVVPVKRNGRAIMPSQRGYLRTGGYYGGTRMLGTAKERKFHDVALADTLVSTTGTVHTGINLIAQGVTESTRVGRAAFIKSIFMRMTFQLSESTSQASGSDWVRTIVLLDKQANGALPTVADVITAPSIPAFGFNNLANKQRFHILYDKWCHVRIWAAGGNGTAIETMRSREIKSWYKKFKKPVAIEFSSTTGAITEVRSNNFVVISISLQNIIKWDADFRLRFTD